MLGFAPLAALPLSGASTLSGVTASMAATISLAFTATPLAGAFSPMSASVSLTFSSTPALYKDQALTASIPLRFTGNPDLSVAGRPFEVFAIPQSYTVRATLADYSVKAVPRSYTVRAKR